MVLLDENAIKSMAPGRFFRDHKGAVNSLDFHHTEDVMVTVGTFDRPAKNPACSRTEGTARAWISAPRAIARGSARKPPAPERPHDPRGWRVTAEPPKPRSALVPDPPVPPARISFFRPSSTSGKTFFLQATTTRCTCTAPTPALC
jgi:hypothetical protein